MSPPPADGLRRDSIVVDAEHFDRTMGLLMEQLDRRDEKILVGIRASIADGFGDALAKLGKDPEIVKGFWSEGYKQLRTLAGDDVHRSIGKRILTWIFTVLLGAAAATALLLNRK